MDFTPTFHLTAYDAISPSLPALSTKGKSILITGGGYGIGAFAARSFCESGATRLALSGRTESKLKATAESLNSEFPETEIKYYVADVMDEAAVASIFSDFGAPDILLNNAGVMTGEITVKDCDLKQWWKTIEVNVLGVAIVTQQYLRAKKPEQEGVVIMMNSAASHWGKVPGWSHYTASKASLLRMSGILQTEHPEVRFINVHPGFVETAMLDKIEDPGLKGMPRSSPELVGNFINWACSEEAGFLAGRMVWASWDVEEMKKKGEQIVEKDLLTYTLAGI